MVPLFPITILSESNLTGIIARIRAIRPDWNESNIIETKHSHQVDYSSYHYNEGTIQETGDVTYALNGERDNGLTLISNNVDENFSIIISSHSLKIKLKRYEIQKFLITSFSPREWVLEGCTNSGKWEFIDHQKDQIPLENHQDEIFSFKLPDNNKFYSSFRFNINQHNATNQGIQYLRIKNIEFYGELEYAYAIITKDIYFYQFKLFEILTYIFMVL